MPPKRRPTPRPRPPRPDPAEAQIARINELTRVGKANWFILIFFVVFISITLLGVEDADFFIASRRTSLPIVNVAVPTFSFFASAPVLCVSLHCYLHLHIRKVIEALTDPRLASGHTPIEIRIVPWLFNDTVLMARGRGWIAERPMDWLGNYTTLALVWLAGPSILGLFWWRSAPANAEFLSMLLGSCFWLSLYASGKSWTYLRARLRDEYLQRRFHRKVISALTLLFILGTSWIGTEGGVAHYIKRLENTAADFLPKKYPPFIQSADLQDVVFASFPPHEKDRDVARHRHRREWCERIAIPLDVCGRYPSILVEVPEYQATKRKAWCIAQVVHCDSFFERMDDAFYAEWTALRRAQLDALEKPDLRNKDLRFADMRGADLAGVFLSNARMDKARLSDANMEGATLTGARMRETSLSRANLEWADLRNTHLNEARLDFAKANKADFSDARMNQAILSDSQMESALLFNAELNDATLARTLLHAADLSYAQINAANFTGAQITATVLEFAQMNEADFTEARMGGAKLEGASMRGAVLSFTMMTSIDWTRARLHGAIFQSVDLSDAKGLTQTQLDGAVGLFGNTLAMPPPGSPPYMFASCWEERPPEWEAVVRGLQKVFLKMDSQTADSLLICSDAKPKEFEVGPSR